MKHKTLLFIALVLTTDAQALEPKIQLSSCGDQDCMLQEFETATQEPISGSVASFKGSYQSYISEKCHYKNIEGFFAHPQTNLDLGKTLTAWLSQCEKELSRFNSNSITAMLNLSSIDYAFKDNPKIQQVKITYDNKTIVSGLLVLKDQKKRPLIIVKNGVFGNAEDTSTVRQMLMHLTEEAPFHALILGNLTGDDFIKDNGYIAMGGFEEGRQIHKVVDLLLADNSPVKPYIYDLHMVGVSLGGNAALMSSLYNEFVSEDKKIKSHIAYCPVVNLERSLDHIYQPKGLGVVFSFITKRMLFDLLSFVPYLRDIFNPDEGLANRMVKKVLVEGAVSAMYKRTQEIPWDMDPFVGERVESEQDFWNLNNFTNYAHLVEKPLLVIHSSNDFIVRSSDNSNRLRDVASAKSNVGFVNLNQGGHCSFSLAYGWPTLSSMLQKYILSHSTYTNVEETKSTKIKFLQSPIQNSRMRFSKYVWVYNTEKRSFDLSVTYRQDNLPTLRGNEKCVVQDYRFSDSACYLQKTYSVDASVFQTLDIKMPTTKFEAASLTRFLNTHLVPVNELGKTPYGKGETPTHVIYKTFK